MMIIPNLIEFYYIIIPHLDNFFLVINPNKAPSRIA